MTNPITRTGLWHPKKGTPEAKAFMARLRAMRGKKKNPPMLIMGNPKKAKRNYGGLPGTEIMQAAMMANPESRKAAEFIGKKIPELVREGYPHKEAIAIAFSIARRKGYKVPPPPNPWYGPYAYTRKGKRIHVPRHWRRKARRPGAPAELGPEFTEEKVTPKGKFDPRSFRYKRIPAKGPLKSYILLGCPLGGWHAATQRCRVGTKAHVILRPIRKPAVRKVAANPPFPAAIANDPKFKAELKAYRKRHGTGPVEIRVIKVPKGYPKFMSVYGTSDHAVYDAPKHSTKGKRIHHFGESGKRKPWLVSSAEKGPKFLAYVGGGFQARPDWIYS